MTEGVQSVLTDHGGAKKSQARSSFWQTPSAMRTLKEGIMDPVLFADYITVVISVRCGSKAGDKNGRVYAFFNKSHIDPDLVGQYKGILSDYIEKKKWIESEPRKTDVGPALAIARMIECGDYADFLQRFKNDNFELEPMEHVLLVVEGGKYYHILPTDDLCAFRNVEQVGIMGYSIFSALKSKLNGPIDEQLRKVAMDWIVEHRKIAMEWIQDEDGGNLNASEFRKMLRATEDGGCRLKRLDNQEFQKCLIFDGLLQRVKEKAKKEFRPEEVVELERVMDARETQGIDASNTDTDTGN